MLKYGLEHELRKTRAILRLAYVEQRWGKIDLDIVPDDPDAKHRREVALIDMLEIMILPEHLIKEACEISNDYAKKGRNQFL